MSDLIENPVAAAYLFVLALFGGGLAYLLWLDTQATARREAALKEQLEAADMLRAQGLVEEAAAVEKDLKKERKPPAPKESKGMGLPGMGMPGMGMQPQGDSFAEDNPGNRFERRQLRAAKKRRKKKGRN